MGRREQQQVSFPDIPVRQAEKQLKKYALHPEEIRKETMESDCILLNQFGSCREALAAVPEKLYSLFPEIWAGEITDWDKLERSLSRTFRLREALDGLEKESRQGSDSKNHPGRQGKLFHRCRVISTGMEAD